MTTRRVTKYFSLAAALIVSQSAVVSADTPAPAKKAPPPAAKAPPPAAKAPPPVRDGQHDFDFEAGTWKIHLKQLQHPLTGSTSWVEFDGSSVTRHLWNGRAEIEEFETDGAAGHIEGMTLRLYSPQTHQWSLFWANSKDGKSAHFEQAFSADGGRSWE